MTSSSTKETSREGDLSLIHVYIVLTVFKSPNFILFESAPVSTLKRSGSSDLRRSLRWEQEVLSYISFDTHCIHLSSLRLSKDIRVLVLEVVPWHSALNHRHMSHKVVDSFNVNNSAWLLGMEKISNPGCCFSFHFFYTHLCSKSHFNCRSCRGEMPVNQFTEVRKGFLLYNLFSKVGRKSSIVFPGSKASYLMQGYPNIPRSLDYHCSDLLFHINQSVAGVGFLDGFPQFAEGKSLFSGVVSKRMGISFNKCKKQSIGSFRAKPMVSDSSFKRSEVLS
jgi:hypothetical protein